MTFWPKILGVWDSEIRFLGVGGDCRFWRISDCLQLDRLQPSALQFIKKLGKPNQRSNKSLLLTRQGLRVRPLGAGVCRMSLQ